MQWATALLEAIARWDFPGIARAADSVVARARQGDHWLDPDLLCDASVTARLILDDRAGARAAFAALAPYSRRHGSNLRTRLLESLVLAAEPGTVKSSERRRAVCLGGYGALHFDVRVTLRPSDRVF